ncbi:MAG: DedA family protein [Trueperaceae bacterium]|nr:DedA family protein [Trueperaceae bacterium]
MEQYIQSIMNNLGYLGIAFLMFLENVFPPLPSELIMPLAGFSAELGEQSLVAVIVAGSLGSLIGQLPLFYLGKLAGRERLERWVDKYGRWLSISGKDISKANDWFDRYKGWAVCLCRLIPGIRSLISIPAGLSDMNLFPFLLYTLLGTSIWTTLLAYLGYILGDNYQLVAQYLGPVSYGIIGLLALLFFGWVLWRRVK